MACRGEQDDGNNKDKTEGAADTLQVSEAFTPNFNMEIAANVLVDKTVPVVQLDVPGVLQPNSFKMEISAIMLEDR